MPFWPRLIELLVAAPHRVSTIGDIVLTPANAALLRASDFPDAKVGPWRIPPIPAQAAPKYLFRLLPQLLRADASVVKPCPPPAVKTPRYAADASTQSSAADGRRHRRQPLLWRLSEAARQPDCR